MPLFGAKKAKQGRCPECQFYVFVQSKAYCSKAAPKGVNIRMLSEDGVRRVCTPCPGEMSCEGYAERAR